MFMRTDPNAEFHAVLRPLSGGPVHFTDRPGKERRDILRRPALSDGSLPLPDDVLTPFGDLLEDPYNGCAALKAYNKAEDAYLVFVANLTKDEKPVNAEFSLGELATSGAYVLHDYFAGAARRVDAGEPVSIRLGGFEYGYYVAAPLRDGVAVIGPREIYVMPKGAMRCGRCWTAQDGGTLVVYAEREELRLGASELRRSLDETPVEKGREMCVYG